MPGCPALAGTDSPRSVTSASRVLPARREDPISTTRSRTQAPILPGFPTAQGSAVRPGTLTRLTHPLPASGGYHGLSRGLNRSREPRGSGHRHRMAADAHATPSTGAGATRETTAGAGRNPLGCSTPCSLTATGSRDDHASSLLGGCALDRASPVPHEKRLKSLAPDRPDFLSVNRPDTAPTRRRPAMPGRQDAPTPEGSIVAPVAALADPTGGRPTP